MQDLDRRQRRLSREHGGHPIPPCVHDARPSHAALDGLSLEHQPLDLGFVHDPVHAAVRDPCFRRDPRRTPR
jgi:hypothetical protein